MSSTEPALLLPILGNEYIVNEVARKTDLFNFRNALVLMPGILDTVRWSIGFTLAAYTFFNIVIRYRGLLYIFFYA